MTERALPVTILEPAGIDPDLLDHSLSLRFDLGQFDPRITFTRNSSATYFGSDGLLKTASANEPRIDYDPATGECKGFLVEESRTNLLTYSEQFDNATWAKVRASITTNAVTAPDGTLTADKLVEDTTASNTHQVFRPASFTASTSYTVTLFVKAAERNQIGFRSGNSAFTTPPSILFDLASLTVAVLSGTASGTITSVGNGWYRCSATVTANSTAADNVIWNIGVGGTIHYTGDGTSGIYIWGAQLEVGAFPTSYIKTEASQVTRAADNAVMTGGNFSSWYRQDEGTVVSEHAFNTPAGLAGSFIAWSIGDSSTFNESIYLWKGAGVNALLFNMVDGGAQQINDGNINPAFSTGAFLKAACAYKLNDAAAVGAVLKTDSLCTIPTVNSLAIGRASWSSGSFLNGHIKRVSYYSKRLSNPKLQALTA